LFHLVVRCHLPTQPTNSTFNTSENAYGTQLLVSCYPGHQLASGMTSAVVFCTENGHWSEDVTCTGRLWASRCPVRI